MAYSRGGVKNGWSLFFLILAGIVLGGFLGSLAVDVPFLNWLNFGYTFGMNDPVAMDLKVVFLQFQISFDISIASLLGIGVAIFVYKKVL
ncbi:MAG: DUF4321 domain-containing protein [Firmicutes bacterium HGW-Firmicutes-1]|jgi:hypothetical protein|nr:MAG: DUF4321 domain-containing protein [Firmicutes bacterium HGW-Firmicutes-1]